jgi:hypothetical protein
MTEDEILKAELRARKKEKKPRKPKPPKPPKVVKTEAELVREYATRVVRGHMAAGRVENNRFNDLHNSRQTGKDLWVDTDFFFSVVFQSQRQKYEFLKQLGAPIDDKIQVQIVNGLELAKLMRITLTPEVPKPYPTGNIDLMPFVLDNEEA